MDENEKQDYEQALAKAQAAIAEAEEQLRHALELLSRLGGPVIKSQAGSASKAARLRKKQADAAIYGIELLYGDVRKEAEASDGPLFSKAQKAAEKPVPTPADGRPTYSWGQLHVWDKLNPGPELQGAARLKGLRALKEDDIHQSYVLADPAQANDGWFEIDGQQAHLNDVALIDGEIVELYAEQVDWTGFDEAPVEADQGQGPLSVACPQCGAQPGARCTNYKGKGCAPHGARKPGAVGEELEALRGAGQ